ncbi:MAG: PaaI family thioesterase [Actinobacteria bacterium]|nr:PaaI family thioesterase [Actinomycetota bacterium]
MDEVEAERERLAAATRSAIRAVRVTEVDIEAMARARALLDEAAALLERETFAGPHSQLGFAMNRDGFNFDAPPVEYFPYSPIIGRCNPLSPPVELQIVDDVIDGVERKVVTGRVTLTEPYNGPPWNYTHGGVVALIFDELLGIATIVGAGGGFTGRLTVHYRKPTPILDELQLRGWVDRASGRKLIAKGEIRAGDTVTAEADGLFIQTGGALSGDG